jgi:hypothetical protein
MKGPPPPPPQPELTLRRYTHEKPHSYHNRWVADFVFPQPDEHPDVAQAVVPSAGAAADEETTTTTTTLYSVYPGERNKTFFTRVPFWVFRGMPHAAAAAMTHVAQVRAPDIYPYFEAVESDWVFVVMAATLEEAKSKLMATHKATN